MSIRFLEEWPEPLFIKWETDVDNKNNSVYFTEICEETSDGENFKFNISFSSPDRGALKKLIEESLEEESFVKRLTDKGLDKIGGVVFKQMQNGLTFPILLFVLDATKKEGTSFWEQFPKKLDSFVFDLFNSKRKGFTDI